MEFHWHKSEKETMSKQEIKKEESPLQENVEGKKAPSVRVIRTPSRNKIASRAYKHALESGNQFTYGKFDIELLKKRGATSREIEKLQSGQITFDELKQKYRL